MTPKKPEPAEQVTESLDLAAYLMAMGCELVRIEGDAYPNRFVFEEVPRELKVAFFQGNPVPVQALLNAQRALKRQVGTRKPTRDEREKETGA